MSFKVANLTEYFETLPRRFDADAAKGVTATFYFDLSDPDGGQHYAVVEDGALSVEAGTPDSPTVTFKMTGENFVKMTNGDLNGTMAYMTGKMKISGAIPMAMKMKNIFPQA